MRPEILFPLFATVDSLSGIGPRLAQAIGKMAGQHVVDLLWHLPTGLIDRRFSPKIVEAVPGAIATIALHVDAHQPPRIPRLPYKVLCSDETGEMDLVFFHARQDYLEKILPVGQERIVSGKIEEFQGRLQITHPDHMVERSELETLRPEWDEVQKLQKELQAKAAKLGPKFQALGKKLQAKAKSLQSSRGAGGGQPGQGNHGGGHGEGR
jgi:ATP-dependent DNA helicase RecG